MPWFRDFVFQCRSNKQLANIILFQFSVKRGYTNLQQPGSFGFIAFCIIQYF